MPSSPLMIQDGQRPVFVRCGGYPQTAGGIIPGPAGAGPCPLNRGHDGHCKPASLVGLPESSVVFSTDTRLKEKQEYYRYGESGWTYKTPPVLSDEVATAMKREKLTDKYRFIWLGVATVRQSEGQRTPEVRGDPNACEYQMRNINGVVVPWLMPKKMFVRTRQPSRFYYVDDLNQQHTVTRPDMVPDSYLLLIDFEYVEYGDLEWRIERKYLGHELVASNVFRKNEAVPSAQWRSILTIRSRDGLYHEPCMAHVEGLLKREYEDRNFSGKELDEVTHRETEERAAIKAEETAAQERAERLESDAIADEHMAHAERAPASVNLIGL